MHGGVIEIAKYKSTEIKLINEYTIDVFREKSTLAIYNNGKVIARLDNEQSAYVSFYSEKVFIIFTSHNNCLLFTDKVHGRLIDYFGYLNGFFFYKSKVVFLADDHLCIMRVADLIANKMKALKSFFSPYWNENDLRLEGKFLLTPTLEGLTMMIDLEKEKVVKRSLTLYKSITCRSYNIAKFLKRINYLSKIFRE